MQHGSQGGIKVADDFIVLPAGASHSIDGAANVFVLISLASSPAR